ncbi:MAG: ABC transporter ATP-binding protein, partial [Coriobacteriia bacterium]|nr:ABC transporter ATP-binding protein [Coriobacteriia bacterium]
MPPVGGPGRALHSLRLDKSVVDQKVAKGTTRRILSFIKPYRKFLAVFLVLVSIDAAVSAANPLIYREIINKGIMGKNISLIVELAALVAGLALFDALLSLTQRWISSKVGEGLIYDLRTKVFDHVQRMSVAFFMRTQTGALVSRLADDVQGAQEAFTDILSTVIGNLISVALVLAAMFFLSWKLTLISLVLLPVFALPAHWLGDKLQKITREQYDLNAQMSSTMVERFNVAGALLVKLFGDHDKESASFADKASRVRDISITRGLYARFFFISLMLTASIATAIVYGWGGAMAVRAVLDVGTVVALTAYLNRLYGPLTALSNV